MKFVKYFLLCGNINQLQTQIPVVCVKCRTYVTSNTYNSYLMVCSEFLERISFPQKNLFTRLHWHLPVKFSRLIGWYQSVGIGLTLFRRDSRARYEETAIFHYKQIALQTTRKVLPFRCLQINHRDNICVGVFKKYYMQSRNNA